jgi:hypothetical protein
MSNLGDTHKNSEDEESLNQLAESLGYTEMETLYASHISQAMDFLLGSK